MKKTLAISLLVCATTFCLCGCASNKGQQTAKASQPSQPAQPKPANPPEVRFPGDERLKVGMTTDEVVQAIGKPLGRGTESDGSQFWTYNHWETPPDAAHYSPVNPRVLVLTVIFDKNGKVLNWYTVARNAY
jgi:outer membrane protein assembly factor BamE (lipoprotein component of BamABCDE complex)